MQHASQHEDRLVKCELPANARALSCTKRLVRVRLTATSVLRLEAVGVELVRIITLYEPDPAEWYNYVERR